MNLYLKKEEKLCPYCGHEMILDDVDYNFNGNQDEYFLCENCGSGLFVKVRYGNVIKKEYTKGE